MEKIYYNKMKVPIGDIFIASSERGVCRIGFPCEKVDEILYDIKKHRISGVDLIEDACFNRKITQQMDKYFSGGLRYFCCELDLRGTEFQKSVWGALLDIDYGTTISYKEIAEKIGNAKASRAVGSAVGQNPIPIIIPCHRVISSNGTIGGFSGGLEIKKFLIQLEKGQTKRDTNQGERSCWC